MTLTVHTFLPVMAGTCTWGRTLSTHRLLLLSQQWLPIRCHPGLRLALTSHDVCLTHELLVTPVGLVKRARADPTPLYFLRSTHQEVGARIPISVDCITSSDNTNTVFVTQYSHLQPADRT